MKYHLTFLLLLLCPILKATNISITMIPQPANLVGDSLPGCIPLTSAVCVANYNYGVHSRISAPHPFIGNAKVWKRGTESDSNLASVFGIQVRPTDSTSVPYAPVEILIKDWDIPAYSPHSKEEVLAATIHCLLLSSNPGPENPLDLRIIAENKKDLDWAKPFEKKYTRVLNREGLPTTSTPVGDTFLKVDGFGINYVISRKTNPKHLTPKANPTILSLTYGDFSEGSTLSALVPVWPGKGETVPVGHALSILAMPNGHFHNISPNSRGFSLESNSLLTGHQSFSIHTMSTDDVVEVSMNVFQQKIDDLASGIAAAAMTAKLNENKPMQLTVFSDQTDSELLKTLMETKGWEKAAYGNRIGVSTTFDYDPKTRSLIKGTLPGGITIDSTPSGQIYLKRRSE